MGHLNHGLNHWFKPFGLNQPTLSGLVVFLVFFIKVKKTWFLLKKPKKSNKNQVFLVFSWFK